ncbi:hypothetical protein CRYUN_Cryun13aG0021900 [Craigia yunnanensis]
MDFQFIPTFLLIAMIPLVLLINQEKKKVRARRLPPGPWKLPVIGNLHQLGDLPHKSIQRLSQKYGSLMFLQLGSVPTLVVSSADAARAIFKFHDVVFSGRPADLYVAKKFSYNLNSISFAPYGELWREIRKIAILELLSSKRVQSFRAVREEEIALMLNHIASSSVTLNLNKLSIMLTNNVVCHVAFGKKYDNGGNGGTSRFDALIHETQLLLGEFPISDYFPWIRWLNKFNGLEARVEKNFRELDKFYDEVMEDHLDPTRTEVNHEDIVNVVIRIQKDPSQGITLSSQQTKAVLMDVLLAEIDTTASTLVWTLTELIRNPSLMERAQAEVREVAKGRGKVEESDLPKLTYLELVIKEALRLHPPVPLLIPQETTEDCMVGDYTIPAKTRVLIDVRSIGADTKYWENPNETKGCPGSSFAILLVQLALANLLYRFDWELPDGMSIEDVDTEENFGLTMFKKTPVSGS